MTTKPSDGLHIASRLFLPLEAVTETFAFLGRRSNGKTYAAMLMAEQMLDVGAQIIVLDPVGAWWGLRLLANGSPGYAIPVFGGLHGDIPLEPTAGALIADVVCDRGISAVLDVGQMISSEQAKFARHFATRFFQRKKAAASAVHLFIEEAQEVVPQNLPPGGGGDAAHMLHAFERLIKLGRNFGVGVSLISQRPQEVNKKALNQTECLFAFQMTGKHERDAIADWTRAQGIEDQNVRDTLPTLKRGEPILWSPQWLKVSKVVAIRQKVTMDVSATPKVGAKAVEPKALAAIDLKKLEQDMTATIERAKADDPKALRAQVAKLKRELQQSEQRQPEPVVERIVEPPAIQEKQVAQILLASTAIAEAGDVALRIGKDLLASLEKVRNGQVARQQPVRKLVATRALARRAKPVPTPNEHGETLLPKCERAILAVLAGYPEGCSIQKIALLGGYRVSGGFRNSLGNLRNLEMIDGANTGTMVITDVGMEAVEYEGLPTGAALIDYWTSHPSLGRCEREILHYLVGTHPATVAIDDLAAATGYRVSGGFRNSLGKLRTAGLLAGRNTEQMTVTEDLAAHVG